MVAHEVGQAQQRLHLLRGGRPWYTKHVPRFSLVHSLLSAGQQETQHAEPGVGEAAFLVIQT